MTRGYLISSRRPSLQLLDVLANIERRSLDQTQVSCIQLRLPLVHQRQRLLGVAYFVAHIVGDSAVGINIVEVLMQMFGQEPGHDGEVLVMRMRQARTILLGFLQRRRVVRNRVLWRQGLPARKSSIIGWDGKHPKRIVPGSAQVQPFHPEVPQRLKPRRLCAGCGRPEGRPLQYQNSWTRLKALSFNIGVPGDH